MIDESFVPLVAGLLTTGGSLAAYFIRRKFDLQTDQFLFKKLIKGSSKLTRAIWTPRIAKTSVLLARFLEVDMIDDRPDLLDKLDAFLITNTPKSVP